MTTVWLIAIMGLLFVMVGAFVAVLFVVDRTEPWGRRMFGFLIGCGFVALGVWMAWPIIVAAKDLVLGTTDASDVFQERYAERQAAADHPKSLPPWGVGLFVLLAIVAAAFLARGIRRFEPESKRARFMFLTIPIGILVLATPAASIFDSLFGSSLLTHPLLSWLSVHVWQHQAWLRGYLLLVCSWLGTSFVSHVAAIPIGPVSTVLTPGLIGAMIKAEESFESNDAWWVKILWWLGVVILGFLVNGVRGAEQDKEQGRRNARAEVLLERISSTPPTTPVPLFSLYLRAFTTTGTLDAQVREEVPLDFETLLERALQNGTPLLALSRSDEQFIVGAPRLHLPDDKWWQRFQELAMRARTIFVLPTDQGATVREIKWLIEHEHLRKCVFIMPETVTDGGLQVTLNSPSSVVSIEGNPADHRADWVRAQWTLQESLSLRLPDYDTRGALFTLNSCGVSAIRHLGLAKSLLKVAKVRTALRDMGIGFPSPQRSC